MALTALTGQNIIRVGAANRNGIPSAAAFGTILCDAAKEAAIMWGQLYWADGGSHTVDTTASSLLEFRTGAATWANGTSRLVVGLATMDNSTGPPARATNVSDVITPSVSYTASGGDGHVTANAWQSRIPDAGTMTIAHAAFVAFFVQMTAVGGADLVNVSVSSLASASGPTFPGVTAFTGGSYSTPGRLPTCIVTASDGTKGWFYGGYVASVSTTTQTWNSGSAQVEYGNFIQFDVPVKAYGIYHGLNLSADCDFVLYSTPTGTPAAMATVSMDANAAGNVAAGAESVLLFTTPQTLSAVVQYFVSVKPGASNVGLNYKTFNAASDANSEFLGTNCYAGSRASGGGAFAAQNSNKDRFAIGLLVGAFDNGSNIVVNSIRNSYRERA